MTSRPRFARPRPLAIGAAVAAFLYAAWFVAERLGDPAAPSDRLAALDARYQAGAPELDAWPLYQAVLTDGADLPETGVVGDPGDHDFAPWRDALERHRDLLPVLREAASRPVFGAPYHPKLDHERWAAFFEARGDEAAAAEHRRLAGEVDPDLPAWNAKLPSLLDVRTLANFLAASARERQAAGDTEGALEDVRAIDGMARQLSARATLIEQAISAAIDNMAQNELRRILRHAGTALSRADLDRIEGHPALEHRTRDLRDALAGEWTFVDDALATLFTASGAPRMASVGVAELTGPPPGLVSELLSMARFALHADRDTTRARLEELREAELRAAADPSALDEVATLRANLGPIRHALVRLLDPGMGVRMLADAHRLAAVQRNATRALLAMLRYRLDRDAWPASIEDLVPEYLASAPEDVEPGTTLSLRPGEEGEMPRLTSAKDLGRE